MSYRLMCSFHYSEVFNLVHTFDMASKTEMIDLTFYSWLCFYSKNKKVFQSIHCILYIRLKMKMLTKPRVFSLFCECMSFAPGFLETFCCSHLNTFLVVKHLMQGGNPHSGKHIQFRIACWFLLVKPGFSEPTNICKRNF